MLGRFASSSSAWPFPIPRQSCLWMTRCPSSRSFPDFLPSHHISAAGPLAQISSASCLEASLQCQSNRDLETRRRVRRRANDSTQCQYELLQCSLVSSPSFRSSGGCTRAYPPRKTGRRKPLSRLRAVYNVRHISSDFASRTRWSSFSSL